MAFRGKSSGSRRPLAVAAVVVAGALAGCAGAGGGPDATGAAESPVPLRLPPLPPEVSLMGMEQGALEDLFGQPSVQRAEQQAEYWRYSLGRCQLDVFLYPDPATGRQEVAYFEVRPTGYEVAGRAGGCSDVAKRLDRDPPDRPGGLPPVESH
jgi:hypothetical protein